MYIWLVGWFVSIIYGMKYTKIEENNLSVGISYLNTLPLRGILAIEIVFGHFYGSLNNSEPVWIGSKIGVLVVGLFLFLSGWGLWESKSKKNEYLKGFIKKHMISLILPLYLLYVVDLILFSVYKNNNIFEVLQGLFGNGIGTFTNWFIWEILVLYSLFYLLYKRIQEKRANLILAILMFVFIIVACHNKIGTRWYGSILCFLFGILFSQNKETIFRFIYKHYNKILICSITCLMAGVMAFVLFGDKNVFIEATFICLSALFFCLTAVIVLLKIRFGNCVTIFLGRISYEIFIIHFTFIHFFDQILYMQDDFLFVTVTMLMTLVVAYGINRLKNVILKRGCKRED